MGTMDKIDVSQDRDKWRALVNEVMNIWFRKKQAISWLGE